MTTKEKELAALVERMESFFDAEGDFAKVNQRVKALEDMELVDLKDVDVKAVVEEVDKLKAGFEQVTKNIRSQRNGNYVPGIEDEGENFSMLKAIIAIRTGNWSRAEHEKALLDEVRQKASHAVGDDTLGGYFVPDQLIADIIGAIYTRSVFINLEGDGTNATTAVSVLSGLTGGNVRVPKFEGGMIAYWIGEEDTYTESQTSVGDMTMNPKKLGVLMRITDTMRKLQGFGFEQLLRQDMIQALAKKLDFTIAFGRGTDHSPLGISRRRDIKVYRAENGTTYDLSNSTDLTSFDAIADWDGGEVTFDSLDNMMLALEEDDIMMDDSHRWISSPRWFKRIKQLKVDNYSGQSTNQPYLLGIPMIPDSRLAEIIGPWDKSTQIPSNALPGASVDGATDSVNEKYTTIFGGNLREVVLGRWGGIEIESDEGRGQGFTSDHTYVKARMYADIGVRQPRALIVCPDAVARD